MLLTKRNREPLNTKRSASRVVVEIAHTLAEQQCSSCGEISGAHSSNTHRPGEVEAYIHLDPISLKKQKE